MAQKNKIRVLIVDDEERFRATATANLQKRGFEITAVGSGDEAIEVIQKDEIDVVVLDVMMPGMDGNETLLKIKMLKPDLEVIMLTGHGTIQSALKGWRDQVFTYLTKPCDIDILAEKILNAVGGKKGVDDALSYAVWLEKSSLS